MVVKMAAMAVSPLAELPGVMLSDRVNGPNQRLLALIGLARIRTYRVVQMARLLAGGDPEILSSRWNRPSLRS